MQKFDFWRRLSAACMDKGVSVAEACRACGIATGLQTKWKNGSVPRTKTAEKLEEYLEIPKGSLLRGIEKAPLSDENDAGYSELLIRFLKLTEGMNREELKRVRDILTAYLQDK